MAFLWFLFVAATIVFAFLYYKLFKASMKQPGELSKEFATVYAGTADHSHQGTTLMNFNIAESTFLDDSGKQVNVDEYDGFVVSGNSMELANVKDGNLLLVRKNQSFTDSTPLPGVFVLKREKALENEGKYKMRRIWAVAYLGETVVENMIRGIMSHPEFMQLKRNTELYFDDEFILNEFLGDNGRLAIYKREHPHWNEVGSEENKVVISTTLRTESANDKYHSVRGKHISFSVHPASLVVGRVCYVYSV